MANLRVDKITSTETFETTGSVQFDGNGDYLTISSNSDFAFGTGDFTIEMWVYHTDLTGQQTYFGDTYGNTAGIYTYKTVNNEISLYDTAQRSLSAQNVIQLSTWHHITWTRKDGVLKAFLDGVKVDEDVYTGDFTITQYYIGDTAGTSSGEMVGHISNVRVVKGKALYTENFKPPMRELEVTPETVLLACQHKTDATHEKTGKTITVVGDTFANELTPGLLTDVVKSGGSSAITGSVEFDGTGDYLSVTPGNDFTFGTNSFTIEMFVYRGSRTDTHILYDHRNTTGAQGLHPTLYYSGSNLHYYVNGSNVISTSNYTRNTWQHYALVRSTSTNTIKLYINGIQVASASDTNDYVAPQSGAPYIGQNPGGSFYFDGFISNLRVIKGTALYTDNFIPPTRELKKVPGTVLLCCQDSNDPTTEATGKTITGFGDLDQVYNTELVTNGDFSDGTNNWTQGPNGVISVSSGQLTITNSGGTNGRATSIAFKTTIGARYVLKYDAITTGGSYRAEIRNSTGGGSEQAFQSTTDGATETFEFQATESQHTVVLYSIGADTIATTYDNVSIQKVHPGKTGSNFTPQVGNDGSVEFVGPTKINTENYFYLPTGDTESRTLNIATQASSSARGLFAGGAVPGVTNQINYITIPSTGNTQDFGDLTAVYYLQGSCSSSTRGITAGGNIPESNVIQYITIPSKGDGKDFGDLVNSKRNFCGSGSQTRGIFFNGLQPGPTYTNTIEYITIATTGNAQDFGDSTDTRLVMGSCSNPTRCIQFGGSTPSGAQNVIDFVTIQTLGNATDFGDLVTANNGGPQLACSSSTRGLFGGGRNAPSNNETSTIEFVTISSTGNAQDFGDLITARRFGSTCSSLIRGVFAGGTQTAPGGNVNVIEYVNIASTGDANDFGDLPTAIFSMAGMSSGHGGLG